MDWPSDPDVVASVLWTDQAVPLRDLSARYAVPNLVKVIKGQYRNIGVAKAVHSELYLHSVCTTKKVLAEAVKVKESKQRLVVSDQRYSIPMSYQGWFEVLSADGKSIKAIHTVQELARLFPSTCLVREAVKGIISRDSGESTMDRMRTVQAGECLTLVGEVVLPFTTGKVVTKRKFLRCMDYKGESVYFGYEQRGLFSPVAGQNNISGVHTIKALLEKFRLPIMVRLVHGIIPTKMEKGFTGVFRMGSMYSDETAFVCPLTRDAKMVPISTREPLKFQVSQNFNQMQSTDMCKYYHQRCSQMLASYMNSIHVLIAMPDPESLTRGREEVTSPDLGLPISDGLPSDQKSMMGQAPTGAIIPAEEEDALFEEIEGIYRYVREGGEPPKPRTAMAKAPAGAPSSHGAQIIGGVNQADEDNYWEEPIYEPLDKIREMKKRSEETEVKDSKLVKHLIQRWNEEKPFSGDSGGSGGSAASAGDLLSVGEVSPHASNGDANLSSGSGKHVTMGQPVSSLRQILKLGQPETRTKSNNAVQQQQQQQQLQHHQQQQQQQQQQQNQAYSQEIEKVYDSVPPPVPPKMYDDDEIQKAPPAPLPPLALNNIAQVKGALKPVVARPVSSTTPGLVSVSIGYNQAQGVPPPSGGVHRHSTGSLFQAAPTSSPASSPPAVLPSNNSYRQSHRISVRPSPPKAPSAYPPYVAVANVGPYHGQAGTVSAMVNNQLLEPTTDLERRNTQMYL